MTLARRAADIIGASRRVLVSRSTHSVGDKSRLSCGLPAFLDLLPG